MKILFGNTFLRDPEQKTERDHWSGVLRGLPRTLHRAAAASAGREAIRDLLPTIKAPTLVVSGTEDRPISPDRATRVHRGIAGSRFVAVPATGHAVMIEKPAAFNSLLADFLQEVEAR
jgi:pimeloyl-ACP methyl ester carboxylesterase